MATPVLIPISEYLNTSYHPDCDYIDGKVKERNVCERPHSLLQGILFTLFQANRRTWGLLPLLEQRVQTSAANFRVPDLCAVFPGESDPIVRVAPLLCIEIFSSGDTLKEIQKRALDYFNMGVRYVWIIDPLGRLAYEMTPDAFNPARVLLSIPGREIKVYLAEVFEELDDLLAGRL